MSESATAGIGVKPAPAKPAPAKSAESGKGSAPAKSAKFAPASNQPKPAKAPKPAKPQYGVLANVGWMLGLAWGSQNRMVIVRLLLLVLAAVGINLLGLFAPPLLVGAIAAQVSVSHLAWLVGLLALGLVLAYGLQAYVHDNMRWGRIDVRIVIKAQIVRKRLTMSYPHLEDEEVEKKYNRAQRATASNYAASEAVWETLQNILAALIGFVIYIALLGSVNLWIVLFILVSSLAGFLLNNHLLGWGYRHREENAEYSHKMNYVTDSNTSRAIAKDFRVFGMAAWLDALYQQAYGLYMDFSKRREAVYLWADIVNLVLTFARNALAYWVLVGMVLGGGLSAAQFLLYFTAVGGFAAWLNAVLSAFSTLRQQSLDLSQVREYLDYPELFAFENGQPLAPVPGQPYTIELRDVSFRYPGADQDILSHLNLTVRPGEKLAIVGLNGAGKSTLVKLICGFYDPTAGQVLLNGQDIRRFDRRDIYRHFTAVFQDFSVLAATVAQNVAQADGQAEPIDQARVLDCLERAGLSERVAQLPQGLETQVGTEVYEDGVELSGGQTQRLMLARALYRDAPIIVLDEPTAALDPIAESQMYERYNELVTGRTSFFISHRLASTRFCDRIILLGEQRILEEGTHDSLMAAGGPYAELFAVQSKYYQAEAVEAVADRVTGAETEAAQSAPVTQPGTAAPAVASAEKGEGNE